MFSLSRYNYVKNTKDEVYIYNLIYRSFIKLSYEVFQILERNEFEKLDQNAINILLKYGVICPDSIDESLVMKSFLSSKLNASKSLGVILSMTSLCDFNCSYCFEDYRKELVNNKKYIDKETIDEVFEYILKTKVDEKLENISIAYFGGEPLFNINNLEYAIKKFSSIDEIPVSQTLITNGFNMNNFFIEEIILKNNINVQITLDGPKEIHNMQRTSRRCKNTFDVIVANLKKICQVKPENCILRVNVQNKFIEYYYSLFDYISDDDYLRNIGSINICPIFDGQLKSNCNSAQINDKIIDLYKYVIEKKLKLSINIEYGPCLCKSIKGIIIDENLNTYSCPGSLYQKNIGFIKNGVHIITNNSWYEDILKFASCIDKCKYAPICYGPCTINNMCYKDSIEMLLPLYIEQKISTYTSMEE